MRPTPGVDTGRFKAVAERRPATVPSTRRRLLASLGAAALGGLAGCSALGAGEPPAGSLRFRNDHSVPHEISLRVLDVGAEPGEGPGEVTGRSPAPRPQRRLTTTATVRPGETQTYEGVFTYADWYGVQFTVDGAEPENDAGRTAFNPAPADREYGNFLVGRVYESGGFSWVVSTTRNPGAFEFGGTDR